MAQSLGNIVQVNVTVSPLTQSAGTFNIGLIVGTSTVISKTDRVKVYSGLTDMKTSGWAGTEPEYVAATLYFSQTPTPAQLVVGRWDQTSGSTETAADAITACRIANGDWFGAYVIGVDSTTIPNVAADVEDFTPASVLFYDTDDADVLNGVSSNIMDDLKTAGYKRSLGIYSTTNYAGAAVLGRAMGLNTGGANSSFTLAYKNLVGVTPESLTTSQVQTITGYNGNVYTQYGPSYYLLVQGTMADGTHFDEVLNLDMLAAEIQIGAVNALVSASKIPQTEDGMALLVNAISEQCDKSVNRGAIAPGVWKAAPILTLQTGDTLSKGYLVLADSIASQTQSDRDARKAPPIYVPVKLAGAIEHAVINVSVNR